MSIADNVRKAALEKSSENLPKGTNTADLQTQAAVGATGKGQSTGQNLKQSNIAEQMGMASARGAQQDVAVKGLEAAQKVASKEAEVEVQQKEINASNRNQEMQHDMEQADKMDQVLSDIEYSDAKMEDRKDALKLENISRQLRLSDEKYRHEIEQIGTRNRIDTSKRIAIEATRLELGERTALLYQKIEDRNENLAEERADKEKKLMVSLDDAFNIAEAGIQDEVKAAKISAVKDIGVAGYKADVGGVKTGTERYLRGGPDEEVVQSQGNMYDDMYEGEEDLAGDDTGFMSSVDERQYEDR